MWARVDALDVWGIAFFRVTNQQEGTADRSGNRNRLVNSPTKKDKERRTATVGVIST